ncbi:hypothetical protein UFOVP51_63 [uncultured Caudovirales phage]|uniref:Uncharacterized protein n=1 Tax=uncultured Caudovirales phage TaxID=2100421 RepID=A0A6J5KPG9_9CAUD|nr:hypothetical protein UFOVP51_63 [uncultured Caudovirales phage]CAB4240917.1 hypothetical protein UFOVP34_43 [uncultured Caudovirales phage]
MDFESIVENQKRNSAIINNYLIDDEYLKDLITQLPNKKAQSDPNFNSACIFFHTLCDRIAVKVLELKEIVPIQNGTIEADEIIK